jgi:hypothetical protein
MTVEDYTTNEECLKFLFKNDKYFQKLLRSWSLAGQYISENKRYVFNYKSLSSNSSKMFQNNNFENMIRRPCVYLDQKYNCCTPTSVSIELDRYKLDKAEQDYMKDYGMAYYYVNRIVRKIEVVQRNIQEARVNEPLLRSKNITCNLPTKKCYTIVDKKNKTVSTKCIEDPLREQKIYRNLLKNDMVVYDFTGYNKINATISNAKRCSVSIQIPPRYFPNIKDSEIEKHYTVPELLQLSRFR